MHGLLARTATITLRILVGLVLLALVVAIVAFFVVRGLVTPRSDEFGTVEDEAKRAGVAVETRSLMRSCSLAPPSAVSVTEPL